MGKYNFDEIIDRTGTYSINTDGFRGYIFHAGPEKKFPFPDSEFVRMWIADMEFAVAPEIREAIIERVNRKIYGYTVISGNSYYNAFSDWCEKKYGWHCGQDELTFSSGVIPALYQLVEILCAPNEKVVMLTPAYSFFQHAAEYSNIRYECSDMIISEDGNFSINFEDLENKLADISAKLLIWCNPHNPSGNLWTDDELSKVAEIVKKYNLWVISDEIHCDLLRSGKKHTPLAKIMPDYKKLITCMSASKTFNMAGLQFSNIIIRDKTLRDEFKGRDKNVGFINPIALAAHTAAYLKGDDWLCELKAYLDENYKTVKDFFDKNLPDVSFRIPDATYLAWVKIGHLLPGIDNIPDFFANNAKVLLEGGNDLFVGNADGYIRLNLAMPKATVIKGLENIKNAISSYNRTK